MMFESGGRQISTVLVVDDSEIAHKAFRRIGESRRLLGASSGVEALHVLEREQVDLAIVDVYMPGMNGVEVLLEIRERWRHVCVILMSGLLSPRIVRAGLLAGAFDCIEKSPDIMITVNGLIEACERDRRRAPDAGPFEIPTMQQVQDELRLGLLEIHGGNVTRAAEAAKVHRTSLQRSVKHARERRAGRPEGEGGG